MCSQQPNLIIKRAADPNIVIVGGEYLKESLFSFWKRVSSAKVVAKIATSSHQKRAPKKPVYFYKEVKILQILHLQMPQTPELMNKTNGLKSQF